MNAKLLRTLFAAMGMLLLASLACSLPGSDDGDSASISMEEEAADAVDCIVGKWAMDTSSMQEYLDASMNETEEVFIIGEVLGNMFFTFGDDGIMSMSSEGFMVAVSLDTGLEDFTIDMSIELIAEGSAHYTADGTTLTNTEQDYTFETTNLAESVSFSGDGSIIQITINPGMFISGDGVDLDQASTTYECSGDSLTFTGDELYDVKFIRAE